MLLNESRDHKTQPIKNGTKKQTNKQTKQRKKKLIRDIFNSSVKIIGFISLISGTIYGVIHLLTLL